MDVARSWLKGIQPDVSKNLPPVVTGDQAVQELILGQEARERVGRITGVDVYRQTDKLTKPDIFRKQLELAEKLANMTPDQVHQQINETASQRVRNIMDDSSRHH